MKIIRWFLGKLILTLDALFTPTPQVFRNAAEQADAQRRAQSLSLYQYEACPFCVKVRRELKRLNIRLELRDAKRPGPDREALRTLGGKTQVPCLRIEQPDGTAQWMYESSDIIAYLQKHFSASATGAKAHAA